MKNIKKIKKLMEKNKSLKSDIKILKDMLENKGIDINNGINKV